MVRIVLWLHNEVRTPAPAGCFCFEKKEAAERSVAIGARRTPVEVVGQFAGYLPFPHLVMSTLSNFAAAS